jgi:hypothetical protein
MYVPHIHAFMHVFRVFRMRMVRMAHGGCGAHVIDRKMHDVCACDRWSDGNMDMHGMAWMHGEGK